MRHIPITCDPDRRLKRLGLNDLQRFQGDFKSLHADQYKKLKQSMEDKGFFAPIFVWGTKILDGHQRLNVLEKEGWDLDGGVPVVEIQADNEKDAAEKLLLLSSTYGKVDPQGLYEFGNNRGIVFQEFTLPDLPDFDMDEFLEEYAPETGQDGTGDAEAIPEVEDEPVSIRGDLWILGKHRVLCGDATNQLDMSTLMGDATAEMVFTDPPYGVSIGDKNVLLNSIGKSNRIEQNLENDTLDEPELRVMLDAAFASAVKYCTAGAAWYVAAPAGPLHVIFGQALKDLGIWRQTIQWVKNNATFSPMGVDYHWQAEPIFYGWLPNAGHRYRGGRKQTTVWQIDRPMKSPDHPTMKPLELVVRAVINSSDPDHIVLDPFLGSGTTLIAAEQESRICYGLEIAPQYVDVIVKRWEAYTGQDAQLEDGRTFAEVADARLNEVANAAG